MENVKCYDRAGHVVNPEHWDADAAARHNFDVKVRTSDSRLTYWFGGRKSMTLQAALEIFKNITNMEYGYTALSIQEF